MICSGREGLYGILHNPRENVGTALVPIEFLRYAIVCNMVKESAGGYMKPTEQAFLSSWMRHLPKCMLPANPIVFLMMWMNGLSTSSFMLGILARALILTLLAQLHWKFHLPWMQLAEVSLRLCCWREWVMAQTSYLPYILTKNICGLLRYKHGITDKKACNPGLAVLRLMPAYYRTLHL